MSKTLLITGGASGIGAETARHAATRGYAIAINYRTRDTQARKVVADIEASGGKAIALPGDMAREADIVRLFGEAEKALGPITHLVNSAGTNGKRGRVDEYDSCAPCRPASFLAIHGIMARSFRRLPRSGARQALARRMALKREAPV
jgi:NAD(P)-dependent dehydrogenase (short-subunit alcohol dehydrogenase family)